MRLPSIFMEISERRNASDRNALSMRRAQKFKGEARRPLKRRPESENIVARTYAHISSHRGVSLRLYNGEERERSLL